MVSVSASAAAAPARSPSRRACARRPSSTPSRRRARASGRAPRARHTVPPALPVGTLKRHGRDAFAPVGKRERQVVADAGRDEDTRARSGCSRQRVARGSARRRARCPRRRSCPSSSVGPAQSRTLTRALPTGLPSASARHPHQRRFAAELEVHAEVGDQRRRADVVRRAARRTARRRAAGSRARRRRSPGPSSGMPIDLEGLRRRAASARKWPGGRRVA